MKNRGEQFSTPNVLILGAVFGCGVLLGFSMAKGGVGITPEKKLEPDDPPLINLRPASAECPVCPECRGCSTDQQPDPPAVAALAPLSVDQCRDVFGTKGQGGIGVLKNLDFCDHRNSFQVCEDLRDFTGLAQDELENRLRRQGRFHFEGEHAFWNPQTATELAWYYSTSVDYLFANAAHSLVPIVRKLNLTHAPVLDFSGGVGNHALYLASEGIQTHYFGIGMMEYNFAEYRIRKRGLEQFVDFIKPFTAATNWTFDPVHAALPGDASLGAILAIDVLEHIPEYHKVVKVMVDSLRVGGIIMEQSPFSGALQDGDLDVRVHVSNGGVSLEEAMGVRMKKIQTFWDTGGIWEKVSE